MILAQNIITLEFLFEFYSFCRKRSKQWRKSWKM